MKREAIDFFLVEDKHLSIHKRLENWARWCDGRRGAATSPMFRLYVPDEHWEGQAVSIAVDILCACDMQKGVSRLPKNHAIALNWNYVHPSNPVRKARELGESIAGLAKLIRAARQMLVNRGFEKYNLQRA